MSGIDGYREILERNYEQAQKILSKSLVSKSLDKTDGEGNSKNLGLLSTIQELGMVRDNYIMLDKSLQNNRVKLNKLEELESSINSNTTTAGKIKKFFSPSRLDEIEKIENENENLKKLLDSSQVDFENKLKAFNLEASILEPTIIEITSNEITPQNVFQRGLELKTKIHDTVTYGFEAEDYEEINEEVKRLKEDCSIVRSDMKEGELKIMNEIDKQQREIQQACIEKGFRF